MYIYVCIYIYIHINMMKANPHLRLNPDPPVGAALFLKVIL